MGMTAVRIRVLVFKDCFLYLQEDSFMDLQLVLSHRVPPRDLAVLLCNKSNAFYNLGKWNEAFVAAKECLQWDPTYVKVWCKGRWESCCFLPLSLPPPLPSKMGVLLIQLPLHYTQVLMGHVSDTQRRAEPMMAKC